VIPAHEGQTISSPPSLGDAEPAEPAASGPAIPGRLGAGATPPGGVSIPAIVEG
jgi:hypothetical protein